MGTAVSVNSTVVATKDQLSADLLQEAAILNLKDGIYYGLNPVGAHIWKLIQEPKAVSEIRDSLLRQYEVDAHSCELDLLVLLQDMANNELITVVNEK